MTTHSSILYFGEFDQFYQAIGLNRRASLPNFDLIPLETSRNVEITFMPPFRKDWYQVVIKLNPAKPVTLNTASIELKNTLLLFNSPHHVYSWQLDTELRGFTLFFKPDFLSAIPNLETEFQFFQLTGTNLISLVAEEVSEFEYYFRQMLVTSVGNDAYRPQILQSLLMALLYRCKSAYQSQQQAGSQQPRQITIASRFQQLVNTFFLEKKTVAAYAELLNLTPNYLNEVVKEVTGKTARQFIVERLLTEAKNLIRHTDLDMTMIAHTLQFDEPTNFSKFFKNYTGLTPGQFREQGRG